MKYVSLLILAIYLMASCNSSNHDHDHDHDHAHHDHDHEHDHGSESHSKDGIHYDNSTDSTMTLAELLDALKLRGIHFHWI